MVVWFRMQLPEEPANRNADDVTPQHSSVHDFAVLISSQGSLPRQLKRLDFSPAINACSSWFRDLQTPPKWDNAVLSRAKQVTPGLSQRLGDTYRVLQSSDTTQNAHNTSLYLTPPDRSIFPTQLDADFPGISP